MRRPFSFLLSAAVIAALIVPAVVMEDAFASVSYDATSENTNNQVVSRYYVVGIYLSDGVSYTPASTTIFNSDIVCTRSGGDYLIDGVKQLTPDNLYIMIGTVGISDVTFTLSVTASVKDGSTTIVTPSVTVHDPEITEGDDTVTVLSPNKYYKIVSTATFSNVIVESDEVTESISIDCIISEGITEGIFVEDDGTVSLKIINEIVQQVVDENPENTDNELTSGSEFTAVINEEEVQLPSVYVSNILNPDDGVSNPDGSASLSLNVPMNKSFVIVMYDTSGSGTSGNFVVTINNKTYTGSATVGDSPVWFFIANYSNPSLNHVSSQSAFQNYVVNPNKWMISTTGTVNVELTGSEGLLNTTLRMELLFKP